jgi:hypothetical protein
MRPQLVVQLVVGAFVEKIEVLVAETADAAQHLGGLGRDGDGRLAVGLGHGVEGSLV